MMALCRFGKVFQSDRLFLVTFQNQKTMTEEQKKELEAQQKAFMAQLETKMNAIVNEAVKGFITPDKVKEQVEDLLKGYEEKFGKKNDDVAALADQVKTLGENIAKMKSIGFTNDQINDFANKVDEMMESEQYKDFIANRCKSTGRFTNLTMKDVSMTNDYQGNILIAQQSDRIVSQVGHNKQHLKDVITTLDILIAEVGKTAFSYFHFNLFLVFTETELQRLMIEFNRFVAYFAET